MFQKLDTKDEDSRQHLHRTFYQSKTFYGVTIVAKLPFFGILLTAILSAGLGVRLMWIGGGLVIACSVAFAWLYALLAAIWSRLYR